MIGLKHRLQAAFKQDMTLPGTRTAKAGVSRARKMHPKVQPTRVDFMGEGAQGGNLASLLSSTGSTIPPNGSKRNIDADGDEDLDSHGNDLMVDDHRMVGYITMGHGE